jgi:hypothetical protein
MTDHGDDDAAKLREELKSLGVPDTSTETFYTGDVSHPVAIALKVNLLVAAALYRKDWADGIAKADMAYAEKMLRQIAATLRDVDPALLNSLGDIWDIDDDEALVDVMHDGTSTWAPTTTATGFICKLIDNVEQPRRARLRGHRGRAAKREPIDDAAEALLEVWPSTTDGVIALLLLHVGELEGTRGPPHLAPSLCHAACALIRPRR